MIEPHHLHLIISHLPVVGVFIGLALLICGLVFRSPDLKRASLGLFVVCAIGAAVTFASGEPSEEHVERIPGISKQAVERHEDAGKLAAIATYLLGGASLAGLLWTWKSKMWEDWIHLVVFMFAVVAGIFLARAANLGGLIRHPEVRSTPSLDSRTDRDD